MIKDFFPPNVIAGFTKPALKGILPHDVHTALSFLNRKLSVSFLNQPHSATIQYIEEPGLYDGDALFSRLKSNVLAVKTADCLPIFLSSSKLDTIGLVHVGWRSAKDDILNNIKFNLSSFRAALGVGLRKCCFKVGEDFLSFNNLFPFLQKRDGELYFDPVDFAKETLIKKGLKKGISDTGICSFCSGRDFFSYRKNKTSLRTLSFILKI